MPSWGRVFSPFHDSSQRLPPVASGGLGMQRAGRHRGRRLGRFMSRRRPGADEGNGRQDNGFRVCVHVLYRNRALQGCRLCCAPPAMASMGLRIDFPLSDDTMEITSENEDQS